MLIYGQHFDYHSHSNPSFPLDFTTDRPVRNRKGARFNTGSPSILTYLLRIFNYSTTTLLEYSFPFSSLMITIYKPLFIKVKSTVTSFDCAALV